MVAAGRIDELVRGLYDAVVGMDEEACGALSQAVLDEGVDARYAVTHGLAAAMEKAGQLYTQGDYFVPELLLCADALYAGLEVLRPHISTEGQARKRRLIIGTVEGDIHDIGKNLVKVMFEAAGWEIHDLGKDVMLSTFVEEQVRVRADVVALSALMTTSMIAMQKAIEMIKAADPYVAVMVGGAPLRRETAAAYGADGYANGAGDAVREANEMLTRLKK